jgi:hypothetical protein
VSSILTAVFVVHKSLSYALENADHFPVPNCAARKPLRLTASERDICKTPPSEIKECSWSLYTARKCRFHSISADALKDKNDVRLRLYWLHWHHAFQLWHDFEDFGVHSPVIQIGHSTFEERSHACAACLDVPVVAGVICVRPCNANGAD